MAAVITKVPKCYTFLTSDIEDFNQSQNLHKLPYAINCQNLHKIYIIYLHSTDFYSGFVKNIAG